MESLRDRVVAQLRELILGNELEPGTRLTERGLSERLGVSRVPVREALMVLESELLVTPTRRPDGSTGAGAQVSAFGRAEVAELFDAREALEPLVARLAAEHRGDRDLERLGGYLETAGRAAVAGDDRAGAIANAAFHRALVQACGSGLLGGLMAPLSLRVERLFRLNIAGRAPQLADDHSRLLDALERRDAPTAELLARLHVVSTRAGTLALFDHDRYTRVETR